MPKPSKTTAADPIWIGHSLPKLRQNPHYTAGYHRGFPYKGTTDEDRAAYQLGKDEAKLTRNFNIF